MAIPDGDCHIPDGDWPPNIPHTPSDVVIIIICNAHSIDIAPYQTKKVLVEYYCHVMDQYGNMAIWTILPYLVIKLIN